MSPKSDDDQPQQNELGAIEMNGKAPEMPQKTTFEDALTRMNFGRFNYVLIFYCGIILTGVVLEWLGIGFVLTVAQCDMKLTTGQKGILSGIGFAGIVCSSFLWGYLADTLGRKKIMQPTLFLTFVCAMLTALTSNFGFFAVTRFFSGFFISGSSATVYAYLGEFHSNRYRSKAIMYASAIYGMACVLIPIVAWLVINQSWSFDIPLIDTVFKPWRLFLAVSAVPSLLASIGLLFLPESPKYVLGQGDQAGAIAILEHINRVNNGKHAKPLGIRELHEEAEVIENRRRLADDSKSSFRLIKSFWTQITPLFTDQYLRITVLACVIQFGTYITSNGLYLWFPDILNRLTSNMNEFPGERITTCSVVYRRHTNISALLEGESLSDARCVTQLELSTYLHSMVLEGAYVVGLAIIGVVLNVFSELSILSGLLVICGLTSLGMIFIDIPILSIYLFVILLNSGLGVSLSNAATVNLYPTNLRAMSVAIQLMAGRFGSIVGANLAGLLLDTHCETLFGICGALLIICGLLALLIPGNSKKKELM